MIVSSSGIGVALGLGVCACVCARVTADSAKIDNAIRRLHRFLSTRAEVILVSLRKSAESADKSMLLQETVQIFRQLSADPFRGGNFLYACFAQAIHRAEPPQQ